ncbi:riboflavin synthase [bacterium]|nr:riboflavin synthase [bacterium]
MFTGIIEELGVIKSVNKKTNQGQLVIECLKVLDGAHLGDSIAVNGVCLTVVEILSNGFVADVSPETFKVTALGNLKSGDIVNLERAMKADGRFGGHLVSGHIDGRGKFIKSVRTGEFYELSFELSSQLLKYVITKGSIAINGVSLTIAGVNDKTINLAIIPHTYEKTNLQNLKNGDFVNIEVDMIAKYVEKFVSASDNKSRISLEFLQEHGF